MLMFILAIVCVLSAAAQTGIGLYGHLQVDLQGTYSLPKGFTAVAYALNLNNEVFGFYTVNPIQREFYKQTFGGGLRWSPTRER